MEQNTYDYLLIDPASTEFNRGSFCYLPYILYMALREEGCKVLLWENFTGLELDDLPQASEYLVALWSHPQLDACHLLRRYLPQGRTRFFGYTPLIEAYGFPLQRISNEDIKRGIGVYPWYYKEFKYLLLSDCDMHLAKYEGKVYPLFTSYGCKRNCAFCPTSVNCKRTRVDLPFPTVMEMLDHCRDNGKTNIHFTDENFFADIDRTYSLLNYMAQYGDFKTIALADANGLQRFLKRYGGEVIFDSGLKIVEVGLETADPELAKRMGKDPVEKYERLAELAKDYVDIFWLTLSFFPGETLKTLNRTGEFLSRHGFRLDELYGRIATNSTEGGLGQFFQPYHGTKGYEDLPRLGKFISDRPIRLIPSYLPNSFLQCQIEPKRDLSESDLEWFRLYNLNPAIYEWKTSDSVADFTSRNKKELNIPEGDTATFLGICARLRII